MNRNNSQTYLHEILDKLSFKIKPEEAHRFYTRLGGNFHTISSIFNNLYGDRKDSAEHLQKLIKILGQAYIKRPERLKRKDIEREKNSDWFLCQKWVGMALYANRFAENIEGVSDKIPYFEELGINLIHLMPIMKSPKGASDGGYAISDFRKTDPRSGKVEDLLKLSRKLDQNDILLTLDVVLNHTSNEHIWARKAIGGDSKYEDYYYLFNTKEETDLYEEGMPEIFPETSSGSFTWNSKMKKWAMTVFHDYQWDLNYRNPAVLIEMIDIILYYANIGADILRLDAVAFLWKKIGTTCQNLEEAHLILQLIRACSQVTAPGVIFIAEAIVAPEEVIKYFGHRGEANYRECDIAYNATLMALLWDSVATKNAKLLSCGIKSLPRKPDSTTWLNYIRCHDDIGLGFSDDDIALAGYDVHAHRQFLLNYFTGGREFSAANGLTFGENTKTGDARIAGTLASLVGLYEKDKTGPHDNGEAGSSENIHKDIDLRTDQIIMLHSLILAFEGIPLLYYGDEIATTNDLSYLNDCHMKEDTRWAHRPLINWSKVELRKKQGTVEHKIFYALKRLIALRRKLPSFRDSNSYILPVDTGNHHVICWLRGKIIVVANFAATKQYAVIPPLQRTSKEVKDMYSEQKPSIENGRIALAPFSFMWLSEMR